MVNLFVFFEDIAEKKIEVLDLDESVQIANKNETPRNNQGSLSYAKAIETLNGIGKPYIFSSSRKILGSWENFLNFDRALLVYKRNFKFYPPRFFV
jgi:hypothetical protein